MAEEVTKQPIIIKKIKKGGHGHHGGAWKIAYADFVTAMMAFFLLLWLLNSVTQESLEGISNYFAPISTSQIPTMHCCPCSSSITCTCARGRGRAGGGGRGRGGWGASGDASG